MPKFNILVATELTEEALNLLRVAGDTTVQTVVPTAAAIRAGLPTAHALIARDDVLVDAALLADAPELKIIGRVGAGLSSIDIGAATERGIMVMNLPGISAIAAGEYTIALMLALSRKLIPAHNSLKAGELSRQLGTQLSGKTAGIVGLGHVGKTVAQRCLAFGMSVLASDPYLSEDQIGGERVILVGLKELLARSDFVSIHVPAIQETHLLFDEQTIAQMKPGARLINISQGNVLDETALAKALKDGRLSGAAVDVYSQESPFRSPLVGLDNVIHTPHIAENTVEAVQDLSCRIAQQVLDALRGVDYRNVANMPFSLDMDFGSIRPYLVLAERIGTVLHILAKCPVQRLAVEYRGEDVAGLIKPLTVALLKGLLTPVLGHIVSYVNAPVLASQHGVWVSQAKGLEIGDYTNLVSCQATLEDGEEISMAGTLLDRREPHIVQINDYRIDFVPDGYLLLMGSRDKPGVIGRVGTLMADNQVNIASWHTGRVRPGGNTLTVLTLDQPVPDTALAELCKLDYVRHARQVKI